MVKSRISLDWRTERKKLVRKKAMNEFVVSGKIEELWMLLQNTYSALIGEEDIRIQTMKNNRTSIVAECAIEVVGRIDRILTSSRRKRMN